jgi:hypothetical protein
MTPKERYRRAIHEAFHTVQIADPRVTKDQVEDEFWAAIADDVSAAIRSGIEPGVAMQPFIKVFRTANHLIEVRRSGQGDSLNRLVEIEKAYERLLDALGGVWNTINIPEADRDAA